MSTMPAALRGPLAIDPSVALAAFGWMPETEIETSDSRLQNGTLRISVDGPLAPDAWWGTTYGSIQRQLRNAAAGEYQGLRAIVLDIDSPGGTVTGVAETVAAIEAARTVAPVTAFVRGQCSSAAYWLAAACDKIVTLHTASVGCVGAICRVADFGGALKKMGVEFYRFTSTRTPNKAPAPGSDEFNAEIQALIDAAGDAFLGDLARLRGTPGDLDAVAEFYRRGRSLPAVDALAAGWADAIIPADASGPHAWLLTGEAPPENDDDEGGDCPPCLPFPTVRGDAGHTTEEASMAKTPEGAAPPLTASESAEAAFLAQIKSLTEERATAIAERDELRQKLAAESGERATLAGRIASLEADAKSRAEFETKREIASLIGDAVQRGAVDRASAPKHEAFAAKYGKDALAEMLAGIPSEAAGPRVVLGTGKSMPGGDPDETDELASARAVKLAREKGIPVEQALKEVGR